MEIMDKETHCTKMGADEIDRKIPQIPQNLSAQVQKF